MLYTALILAAEKGHDAIVSKLCERTDEVGRHYVYDNVAGNRRTAAAPINHIDIPNKVS
jgi:ankyrin repeat protein